MRFTACLVHAAVLCTVYVTACTLEKGGLNQAAGSGDGTGGKGGMASSGGVGGRGGGSDHGDTQAGGGGAYPCNTAEDCPGPDTFCMQRNCQNGACAPVLTPAGTALPAGEQSAGDCTERQCGDNGEIIDVASAQDIPPDDGRQCTDEICEGTTPVHKPVALGTECGAATCAGSVWSPAPTCDDHGECKEGMSINCGAYQCVPSTGCKISCQTTADCARGQYCAGSMCKPQLMLGQPCTTEMQCVSGFCADQFCCDGACQGECRACKQTLTGNPNGQCSFIPVGMDPESECPAGQTCSGTGQCS